MNSTKKSGRPPPGAARKASPIRQRDSTPRSERSSGSKAVSDPGAPARRAIVQPDLLPQLIGYNLRRAQIALWRDFAQNVGDGAIRPGLFSLLVLVEANPGIAQIDIATQLDIDKASIVSLVDRLEKRRWVFRKRSVEDRRRQGVYLTSDGQQGLSQLRREMLEHEDRFRRLFSKTELRQFIEYLQRIHPL